MRLFHTLVHGNSGQAEVGGGVPEMGAAVGLGVAAGAGFAQALGLGVACGVGRAVGTDVADADGLGVPARATADAVGEVPCSRPSMGAWGLAEEGG
jgi:hypothetical protein